MLQYFAMDPVQVIPYVPLDHKTSQKYVVCVKTIDFSFMPQNN